MSMTPAKILIVEDETVIALSLKKSLEHFGYEVVAIARSGEEAIEKACSLTPHLVLMDIVLKGEMDGTVAAVQINEQLNIPIIFLSAFPDQANLEKAKRSTPSAFLTKPFNEKELHAVIEIVLKKYSLEQQLKTSEELFHCAFNCAAVGMALVTLDGKVLNVNKVLCDMLGFKESDLVMHPFANVYYSDDKQAEANILHKLKVGELYQSCTEQRYLHKEGHLIWVSQSISVVNDQNSKPATFIFQLQDISAKKLAENGIQNLVQDYSVDASERRMLENCIEEIIYQAKQKHENVALFSLELTKSKAIKDVINSVGTEKLLQNIKFRLRSQLRNQDIKVQVGEDEFVFIFTDYISTDAVNLVAEKILALLIKPFKISDLEITLSPSIGISIYPIDGNDVATLVKHADLARNRVKDEGGNSYQFYSPKKLNEVNERAELEIALRQALVENELLLYYQPIVELSTGIISGVEALLRWQRPGWGLMSPAEFVPFAEELGLIVAIGKWVIKTVCSQSKAWEDIVSPEQFKVAINLSAKQFKAPGLLKVFRREIEETGVNPSNIELEITESSILTDLEHHLGLLKKLKTLGFNIAIDDFTMEKESFNHLRQSSADRLKIDRKFIKDMTTNVNNAAIVTAMIAKAHSQGIKTVAVGVETHWQVDFLKDRNCDAAQGYYFSLPVLGDEVSRILQTHHRSIII